MAKILKTSWSRILILLTFPNKNFFNRTPKELVACQNVSWFLKNVAILRFLYILMKNLVSRVQDYSFRKCTLVFIFDSYINKSGTQNFVLKDIAIWWFWCKKNLNIKNTIFFMEINKFSFCLVLQIKFKLFLFDETIKIVENANVQINSHFNQVWTVNSNFSFLSVQYLPCESKKECSTNLWR